MGDISYSYDEKPLGRAGPLLLIKGLDSTILCTVSMGIYVFEPIVMKYILFNEYLDFPDLVLNMVSAGEKINEYVFDGYWMDLGRPDDYAQAVEDFTGMRPQVLPEE